MAAGLAWPSPAAAAPEPRDPRPTGPPSRKRGRLPPRCEFSSHDSKKIIKKHPLEVLSGRWHYSNLNYAPLLKSGLRRRETIGVWGGERVGGGLYGGILRQISLYLPFKYIYIYMRI
jgi:hypothetical protein